MPENETGTKSLPLIVLLAIFLVAGLIIIWSKLDFSGPVEISLPDKPQLTGTLSIEGRVNKPGYFEFNGDDTIASLMQAAGADTSGDGHPQAKLIFSAGDNPENPQKIDINRAEAWLLEALPGIGEAIAERIVEYRQTNGPFRNTGELLNVPGIGDGLFENVRELITVSGD